MDDFDAIRRVRNALVDVCFLVLIPKYNGFMVPNVKLRFCHIMLRTVREVLDAFLVATIVLMHVLGLLVPAGAPYLRYEVTHDEGKWTRTKGLTAQYGYGHV